MDQATFQARSQKAKILNKRARRQLEKLKQRRNDATGSEREALERAILQLERNIELRSRLEGAPELPARPPVSVP